MSKVTLELWPITSRRHFSKLLSLGAEMPYLIFCALFGRSSAAMKWLIPPIVVALMAMVAGSLRAQSATAVGNSDRVTIADVVSMLQAGVTSTRALVVVNERTCLAAQPTEAERTQLRAAGAAPALLTGLARMPLCLSDNASATTRETLGIGFGPEQFAHIAPGRFSMGTTNGNDDEQPLHVVEIAQPFALQRTEVTRTQWIAVMGSSPSEFSVCGPLCPVEGVSWEDTQRFLAKLNAMDPGRGYRLPTEAEWEYAARAGTLGGYGGTGRLEEMGWHFRNSDGKAHPVAQKRANAWGLFDMHGNAHEWVQDWYGPYPALRQTDPSGPTNGERRVIRGGGCANLAEDARSTSRARVPPWASGHCLGFRLARTR